MEITEMTMEQVETRSAELQTLLNAEDADLEAISNEISQLEERKAVIMAEAEARAKEVADVVSASTVIEQLEKEEVRNKMETIEIRKSPEYINAYAEYIKTGDAKEIRSLLSENIEGTVAVPELVYDIVKTAWEREGIMSRVRKAYVKGNLKVGFEISGTDAVVHTEGAEAPAEETLTLGVVELVPASIKKWITISDEVYDLRGEDFLRYIYDELVYRIAKKAADTLIAKIEACGTTSTASLPAVAVVQGQPSSEIVVNALAALSDEADKPVIIMNKITWGAFKYEESQAQYAQDIFNGMPVIFNNSLPSYADAQSDETFAIVGDLGFGALANFPSGEEINIKFDDLSLAESDLIKIVGRQFVGLGVVAPNAFVKLTK